MTKGKGLIHHGLIITVIWGMLRSIRMDIAAAIGMNEIHGESEPVLHSNTIKNSKTCDGTSANMVSQLVLVIRNRTSHVSL